MGIVDEARKLAERLRAKTQQSGFAKFLQTPVQVSKPVARVATQFAQATPGRIVSQGIQQNAPYYKQAASGFTGSSTFGLAPQIVPPPKNIGEKAAYGVGFVGGLFNPLNPITRVASGLKAVKPVEQALRVAQKPLGTAAGKLIAQGGAKRLLGKGVANLSQGIPITAAYALGKTATGQKYTSGNLAGDVGIDVAAGALLPGAGAAIPLLMGLSKQKANLSKFLTQEPLIKALSIKASRLGKMLPAGWMESKTVFTKAVADLAPDIAKNKEMVALEKANPTEWMKTVAKILEDRFVAAKTGDYSLAGLSTKAMGKLDTPKLSVEPTVKVADLENKQKEISKKAEIIFAKIREGNIKEGSPEYKKLFSEFKKLNLLENSKALEQAKIELAKKTASGFSDKQQFIDTAYRNRMIEPHFRSSEKRYKSRLGNIWEKSKKEYSNQPLSVEPVGGKVGGEFNIPASDKSVLKAQAPAPIDQKLPPQVETATTPPSIPPQTPPKPVQTPSSDSIIQDPVQKIITALKEAKPIRGKQTKLYAQERAKRVARLVGVGKNVPGEKGYFAQLGQLKGELPKAEFEGVRSKLNQTDIDSLFNKVEDTPLSPFEKISAKGALSKLLGGEGGTVPTRGELKLLNEIFPPEFVQTVLDKRSGLQKFLSGAEELINLPRSFMSTLDLSAPLRQGAFLIGRPKQWVPAFKEMFKYAGDENAYKGLMDQVKSRPTYRAMREGGLSLTDMSPVLQGREEAFMSSMIEKIPGFGTLAKGSNRAYSGFLNKLRADTFDDLYSKAKSLGVLDENPDVVKDIAKFVNSATGRGDLGKLNNATAALNGIFFSPRLIASRLNLLNPLYYAQLDPFVRKEALKSLLTFAGVAGTTLGLASMGGADVGTDPRSADFGKIKIGDTRYDPWGGFQQYIVAASRLLSGQMVSSTTGREFNLGEGYKPTTRLDIAQRLLESKASPVASFVLSILKGQNALGEKTDIPAEAIDRFIPMMIQDVTDLTREWGPKGALMAIPGIFGVGSQTYTDKIPVKGTTAAGKEKVDWIEQPSIGGTIANKLRGKQVSTIPKEKWVPLREVKAQDTIKGTFDSAVKQMGYTELKRKFPKEATYYAAEKIFSEIDAIPKSETKRKQDLLNEYVARGYNDPAVVKAIAKIKELDKAGLSKTDRMMVALSPEARAVRIIDRFNGISDGGKKNKLFSLYRQYGILTKEVEDAIRRLK